MLLRISNIILAVVMVAITTGFSVSKHFCHDRLVNTDFFSVAKSCGEVPESCCDRKQVAHCAKEIDQDDCCKNENLIVKFTEQFTVNHKYNPAEQQFNIFGSMLPDFQRTIFSPAEKQDRFRIVKPPTLTGILLLVQSFLI